MAAKPPDGFLSYTRFDDRHDGGAISEFCRRLASAVQAVTGGQFNIFQDVEGIGIGEHWPGKLDQMLNEARFFIPVLTPSYFTSNPCREELEKFLSAEAARGRNDLVLPIYYIECDVLADPKLRAADPLAADIYKRQYHDWRKLRFSSFNTKIVKTALHKLASEIARARRRTMPQVTAPQTGAEAQGSASQSEQTAAVPPPPAVAMPRRAAATSSAELLAHAPLTWEPSTDLGRSTHVTLQDTLALSDHGVTSRPEPLRPGTVIRDIDAPWCPELVVIPPGEFMMGSTEAEREWAVAQGIRREWVEREKPQHQVHIAYSLAVGRYPVTFEEYGQFTRSTGRGQPGDEGWGRGRRPVINVSWEDARAYVGWLAAETGRPYRLLSEAEWEYACRAGTTTRYWWGDEITPENANYGGNVEKTSEFGSYPASPFGLCDTHGNVWEWVEDCWHDSYDGGRNDGSAWTAGNNSRRVLRGGCWSRKQAGVRSASRTGKNTHYRENKIGFRVARALSGGESITHSIRTGRKVEREGGEILDKPPREAGVGIGGGRTARRRIFLAHAREDKPQVRKLYADLKGRGLDPWLDEKDLVGGQIWKVEIPKAIRRAEVFLACLSRRSVEKRGFVQQELREALSAYGERPADSVYIIPVRLDGCDVPDLQTPDRGLSLQDIHWVDLWQEGGFDSLVAAIEHALGPGERGKGLPDPDMVFRDIDSPWCPELVVIPPGEFMMGSTEAERDLAILQGASREWVESEQPRHRVSVSYWLAVGCYPVTFEEYDRFAKATGRTEPDDRGWGRGRRPVINVSWEDAKAYVEWLTSISGQPYRLLSEAEWGYSCRGGTTARFWWGDVIAPEYANYGRNLGKTSEVGSYHANPFGLYDTHGNVWEWVEDRWHESYNGAPNDGSAWIAGTESRRVPRGGCWLDGAAGLRSAARGGYSASDRGSGLSFRVARILSRSESAAPSRP